MSQLRADCRKPILEISTTLRISRCTVTDRLRTLQRTVIQKYTALLDFRKLGYFHLCFSITLLEEDKEIFCRYIQQHLFLNTLYKLQENGDYFVEMLFPDREQAEDFLSSLQHAFSITNLHLFFVEKPLVQESFLPQLKEGG